MKLKWYDWNGEGDIPIGVVGVRYRDGYESDGNDPVWGVDNDAFEHKPLWNHDDSEYDIIAYTLGEPLEVGCE